MSADFADLLALALRLNIVLAIAIAAVLLLRAPVRALFGARIAYCLWLLPPIAAAATLLPGPVREVQLSLESFILPTPSPQAITQPANPYVASASGLRVDWPALLFAGWALGAAFALALVWIRQARYVRALGALEPFAAHGPPVFRAQSRAAGPAVVGVLKPIIITPADFEERYDPREQRAVIAHERTHLKRGDPLANAAASFALSAFWFNPLVHIGVRALRIDQELACDEAVIGANAAAPRVYAEAMLKAQASIPAGVPIGPLGCAWPDTDFHQLKERIAMLKRTSPSRVKLLVGAAAVSLAALAAGAAAWSAQPTRLVFTSAQSLSADAEDARAAADDEALEGGEDAADREDARDDAAFEARMAELDAQTEALAAQMAALHALRAEAIRAHVEANVPSEAEIEAITREAMAVAEQAIAAHQDEIRAAQAIAGQTAEIQQAAMEIAAHALALANAEMRGELTEAERARMEAEIEARAARLEAWAERIEAEAEAREADHD